MYVYILHKCLVIKMVRRGMDSNVPSYRFWETNPSPRQVLLKPGLSNQPQIYFSFILHFLLLRKDLSQNLELGYQYTALKKMETNIRTKCSLFFFYFVHLGMGHVTCGMCGQGTSCTSQLPPSGMWIFVIKLRTSKLVGRVLSH